ncbi:Lysophospholipid acyltransferase [Gurleya vavrai]
MLDISDTEKRYLLALLAMFLSSLYFSFYKQKHLHIPTSLAILLIAFDFKSVCIFLAITGISFLMLLTLYKQRYISHLLMFFNMFAIIGYKIYYSNISLDICAPLMLFTIKFYYLGRDFTNKSSLKDALVYLFLVPGILAGPVPSYEDYLKIERVKKVKRGLIQIVHSLVYLLLYSTLRNRFNYEFIIAQESVITRIFYALVLGYLTRCKYYFAWIFSYGCYLLMGMDNMKNVHPVKAEFCTSIKELQQCWNIFTNAWLKDSVFMHLKKFGFLKASLATFFVSAIWHGTNICYFLMFLTFSLSVPILNNTNAIFYRFLNARIAFLLCMVQLSLFVSFFMIPFYMLDFSKTYEFWKSLYFYGYGIIGVSFVFYLLFKQKKVRTSQLKK